MTFGDMGLRERLGGEWWLTLNMEVHGEGGILVSLLGAFRVGLWKNIRRGWGKLCSHTRFEKWVMALRLDSERIFGVGIWPLRMPFQFYLVFLVQRMLLLRLTWIFLKALFSGM
jgi:hypothetical protein